MAESVDAELRAFVQARYPHLRRTAFLLCGQWQWAEDLVQHALARVVVAARRRRVENLDAYARVVLTRTYVDEGRRAFRRHEYSAAVPPDGPAAMADSALAVTVLAALRTLPPRQRAAVVLRYWEDRSIEETAQVLGISPGTVKSQCAKALEVLRRYLADVRADLTVGNGE